MGLNTVELGGFDAVATFNYGNITKYEVSSSVGVQPGERTVKAMEVFDYETVRRVDKAITECERRARRKRQTSEKQT